MKTKGLRILAVVMVGLLLGVSGCADKEKESPQPKSPSVEQQQPIAEPPAEQQPQQETNKAIKADDLQANLDKLKDKNFVETTPEGATWYTAAENLGLIGKPAIPALIKKLETKDDYERTQTLYALRLAAQHENVREFTGGEFPNGSGEAFPQTSEHPQLVKAWQAWFTKYQRHFE